VCQNIRSSINSSELPGLENYMEQLVELVFDEYHTEWPTELPGVLNDASINAVCDSKFKCSLQEMALAIEEHLGLLLICPLT